MASGVALNLLVICPSLWLLALTRIYRRYDKWMASDAAIAPHEGVGPPEAETGSDISGVTGNFSDWTPQQETTAAVLL